ncbi:GAF domain-containing protein, partial [Magnetofaba australis]
EQSVISYVMSLSGFQRVLYYAFREDHDGEVRAECRQEDAYGSYLGLRFPASDIPHIARVLYKQNPWRSIPDSQEASVPIISLHDLKPDLTWTDLRSVSPIHQVYLANMGVRSSLSFPIVVNGELVALIAAHHREPKYLPLYILEQISKRVKAHEFAVSSFQTHTRLRMIDGIDHSLHQVQGLIERMGGLENAWPEFSAWLIKRFQADGAVLCLDNDYLTSGLDIGADALTRLDAWFCHDQSDLIASTDSVSLTISRFPLSEVTGVLALSILAPKCPYFRLYLTRGEHIHEISWGGRPDKPLEHHDGALGIAPRHSFEKWIEKRMGHSRPWSREARMLALKLRALLMELRLCK